MLRGDPLSRVLYIDLSRRKYWIEDRSDLFEKYIGGTGAATRLLMEECPRRADPLGPENPIIFAVGPLTAVFPTASKTVAAFKSPLTDEFGESHAGGRSAAAIRMAGYGAIVITGASDMPIYVAVHGDRVYFRDARALWGIEDTVTVGRILREVEPGAGYRTIMRIGGAGERLVRYACVTTETYRHFGRLGLGAVFGSKRLKAVVISGKRSLGVRDRAAYKELYDEIFRACVETPLMKKYHDIGTSVNVRPLNEIGALPTRNLTSARFEGADAVSGEALAERFLGRRLACSHCPVGCIHLAALRIPYEDEPYFYKTEMISYDYELIYSLGTMLGVSDPEGMLKLMKQVEYYGLDAISTGVILAWITEAYERGLITDEDTMGLRPKWGDYSTYAEVLRRIVKQPNDFYRAVARGVRYASEVYGGRDFALEYGGNEMAGYHTGPAFHVGLLMGSRHSHLDSAGYSYDQKAFKEGVRLTPESVAEYLVSEESWRQVLTSLVICLFARGIYKPPIVVRALWVMGYDLTEDDLRRIGRDILRMKYEFKVREGVDLRDLRFPRRVLETPTPHGKLSEGFLRKAAELYLEKLGVEAS